MEYTITRYHDGEPLLTIEVSEQDFAQYEDEAQQPEGLIQMGRLGSILSLSQVVEDDETVVFLTL